MRDIQGDGNLGADGLDGLERSRGQRLDLVGHHTEATTRRARRFDMCVQRRQIGLSGDLIDLLVIGIQSPPNRWSLLPSRQPATPHF